LIDSTPLRVLLAEDEPTQCLLVSRLLRVAGYIVNVVNDGEKALEEIATGSYQMLVTDWDMPRLDGPELCRRVRKLVLPSYLYILILTGHNTTQSVVAGLDAGADDYIRKPPDDAELLARLRAGRRVVRLEQSLRESNARVQLLSITDGLLGVFNRRYLNEKLPDEIQRAHRYRRPLSIVIADLDHFKNVNDRFGHQAGDEVLKCFAQLAQSRLRQASDWIARLGGEEFVFVLPEATSEGAAITAEKIRQACSSAPLVTTTAEINVTASFGVAELQLDEERSPAAQLGFLLRRADSALYRSKNDGRNRVTQAEP
jgi:two-component system, cell cycle response regulator